ncbi:MAG: flagellar protein export ATPase FliI [Alphaproteobacteria bacterium]|nr:flagellar protein export ATPase FliI [Alphaproteobacteria bacterium]
MQHILNQMARVPTGRPFGRVSALVGPLVEVKGLEELAIMGALFEITPHVGKPLLAEVVGFRGETALLMPYHFQDGIGPKSRVSFVSHHPSIYPHTSWCGRVINAHGDPLDGKGALVWGNEVYATRTPPLPAHQRAGVKERLSVGVRAIDTFLTCCKGQRMGIFAGSGVGKSSLLAQIARYSTADIIVIGLIGERGREVRDFIDEQLGPEGMKKCVLVVATSDESAPTRREAAYMTMTVADYFRNQGAEVMCLMDSVTRFAMALREIGLAAGEPPASKGYTPSVFAELPKLLERAGPGLEGHPGSVTGLFTILVEGDDHNEPISDAVRGILDGHIILDRTIAQRGRFPAIHVPHSVSRMVPSCHSADEQELVIKARASLSTYDDMADLIRLGAYKRGASPEVDEAIRLNPPLEAFLSQKLHEHTSMDDAFQALHQILDGKA